MKEYVIIVQFAHPNPPEFPDVEGLILEAIDYYNQKSLIAGNPKSIIDYKLLNPHTIKLVLQSKAELPYPGKALQTFSRYLVQQPMLKQYIYGNQLFKMSAEQKTESEPDNTSNGNTSTDALRLKIISLILNAPEERLNEIFKILKGE